jgi:hypothetical protein
MVVLVLSVPLNLLACPIAAYEPDTHRAIAFRAAQPTASTLHDVMRSELGIEEGVARTFLGLTVPDLIGEGAAGEDTPRPRVLNHFHNPLLAWDSAGLQVGTQLGQSSILWQQNPAQNQSLGGGGNWSWHDARQRYWNALTGTTAGGGSTREQRDRALAETFLTLGHLTHFIQDASVPAHTRNDQHLVVDGYETWTDRARLGTPPADAALFLQYLTQAPVVPPRTIFTPGRPEAPLPIARLIDADKLDGSGNATALGDAALGIAEYTQGNFLSDDTIFAPAFPLPRRQSLGLGAPVLVPEGQRFQRHFPKVGDGESITHFVAESALYRSVAEAAGQPMAEALTLTRHVYRDYASFLLPRAVGYSAALLDYFFRGRLAAFGDTLSVGFANLTEESLEGTLALYYDDDADRRHPVPAASWAVALAPSGFARDLRFPAPTVPAPKERDRYMLVFRGRLGDELEAVAAKEVSIPSVIVVRLVKRSDGTPYPGTVVRTIDAQTGNLIDEGVTDADGAARLRWRPGRTVLFMIRQFPVYWGGDGQFSSSQDGARVLQVTDVDAQGELRVPIPLLVGEWPEATDPCTGYDAHTNHNNAVIQESFMLDGDRTLYVTAFHTVDRVSFTRSDTGVDTLLCSRPLGTCVSSVEQQFVAEDLNRVGQLVGDLSRDAWSVHSRQIFALTEDGFVGDLLETLCVTQHDGRGQVLPVTIGER